MIIIILIIILIILLINKNEEFNDDNNDNNNNECEDIPEGICNSKLCPEKCKIKKTSKEGICNCIKKIENNIN